MIGQTISHYTITAKLGAGGMGEVYLATDTKLDRQVALKFLPESLKQDPEARERLLREAKAASKLNHPNIVTIHGIESVDGRDFIVMEHIEGKTLSDFILEMKPSVDELFEVAIQIGEGLGRAHEAGVIHRDLKPANILIDSKRRARILDFGVARLEDATKLTRTGTTVGTLAYMSPEQFQGHVADRRSDIYSFGAVLYEMIAGQPPFTGEHEAAVMYSVMNEQAPPLTRFAPQAPEELQRIVSRCLAKAPDQRYQTAADLVSDLRTLQAQRNAASPIPRGAVRSQPETRYALSDDVSIAYQVYGRGPIDLVFVPGWVSHVEMIWEHPIPAEFMRRLGALARVITFDKRGTGLSDRVSALPTLEKRMDDVRAVMDAAGSPRAAVFGMSEGASMSALFAATYPERTLALLVFGGFASRRPTDDYPWAPTPEQRQRDIQAIRFNWGSVEGLESLVPSMVDDRGFIEWLGRYFRASASPGAAAALMEMNTDIDIRGILSAIRVPTLVMHRTGDRDAAIEGARYITERVSGARLVEFEGMDHMPYAGDMEPVMETIGRFLAGLHSRSLEPNRQLMSILIGWPASTNDAGTRSFRKMAHTELQRASAILVIDDGPGVAAAFDTPGRALRAGTGLIDAAHLLSLSARAGIHTGECLIVDDAVSGTPFEIARLATEAAAPGQLVLTRTVRDLIAGTDIQLTACGETTHKEKRWTLFRVVTPSSPNTAPTSAMPTDDPAAEPSHRPSRKIVAVLPFANLGPAEDEYFADGMTEEITSRLAAVGGLGVISRTSAMQYKNARKSMREIGAELGADYILEGSVRWSRSKDGPSRVRITPQLIQVTDDTHLWSERYDRVMDDIFAIQSDIAEQVFRQLNVTLLEPERRALKIKPTENIDAYHAYLRGIDHAGRPDYSEEDFLVAIEMFERAVALDSGFALAFAELSQAHSSMYFHGHDRSADRLSQAKRCVEQAFALSPHLAEAHLALGFYYYRGHQNWDRALAELATAKHDLPNDTRLMAVAGAIRKRQGDMETAAENYKRAFELSPRDASLPHEIGCVYMTRRCYAEAALFYERSIALVPDQELAYLCSAWNDWLWRGDVVRSRAMLESIPRWSGVRRQPGCTTETRFILVQLEHYARNYEAALDIITNTGPILDEGQWWFAPRDLWAAHTLHLMGQIEMARARYMSALELLETEIEQRPDDDRIQSSLGIVCAGLGRKDEAVQAGKRAVELLPVSRNAVSGPFRVADLAFIYALLGERDAALDQIEYLLSIPSWVSTALLRLDPRWDPLRDHPRFQALLEREDVVF